MGTEHFHLLFAAVSIPLWSRLTVALALAASVAYAATPVAIAAARRFAFYDVPAGYKGHLRPTPYLGGAAVSLAFVVAVLLGAGHPGTTLPLVAGVAVMFVLGTIDDRRPVSPQLRVVVELLLGAGLSLLGHGWHLGAGAGLDAAVNGIWVVAVVNAFNLFDNMDGAASTMALVAAAGSGVLALIVGNGWAAVASAALCGACLGFLPHNLSRPARIFLGDGGSMPLGFAMAALIASTARTAEPSVLSVVAGALLVGIPVLDTTLVIVSRRRRGISILTGGRDHLTHRTRQRIGTARRVALVLGSAQALVSAMVVVATRASSAALVYLLLAFLVCAAAVIVGLEGLAVEGAATGARAGPAEDRLRRAGWPPIAALALLGALGLGAGLSPLFSGYYDASVWLALGLVLVLTAAAVAVARPTAITRAGLVTLSGLAGLGLWSLISTSWAGSVEQALVNANRTLAYVALLVVLLVLTRGRRRAGVLLLAAGAGVAVVAVSVLVRMLGSNPEALFLAARLNSPLGYINGEGCVFAMGVWLALALAERREPPLAAVGSGGAVVMACLALLSQSRGAAIATFVALIVGLVAIPGARRRLLALAVIAGGIAVAAGPVLTVYSSAHGGSPSPSSIRSAAGAILLGAALAGAGWGVLVALAGAVERRGPRAAFTLRYLATGLAVVVVGVPALGALVRAPSIERTLRTQWHAFVHLSDSPAGAPSSAVQTRLFSGAGNRYDYWRIAWHVFADNPVAGVGAGNYPESYYLQRRTQEAIENPHSLELQTAAELGLVGLALLVLAIAGVLAGAARLRSAARRSSDARTLMVAATGVAVVWLVNTSGDWMHLLPGVTALALIAAVVLVQAAPRAREGAAAQSPEVADGASELTRPGHPPSRLAVLAGTAALALVLAVGGASLLRSWLAQRYLGDARAELAYHPASAVQDAQRSLRLDSANLDAYYVEAAGQARFDLAGPARSTLLEAVHQDPKNFVTWVLLGDLEVRLRDFPSARSFYLRAHALDPGDPSLSALANHPAAALGFGR